MLQFGPVLPLAYAALAIFLGGVLRGFTGFGFAVAAVPLLSLVIEPAEAVAIVALLQVAIGLTDIGDAWRKTDWPSLVPVAGAMAVATPLGFSLLLVLSGAGARLLIALTLILATVLILSGWRFRERPSRSVAVGVGLLSGIFNGLAAMPGPPVVAYYLGQRLDAARTRATLIVYFLMTATLALGAAVLSGLIGYREIAAAIIGFPLLFAGGKIGERLFRQVGDGGYRRVATAALATLAAIVLLRAILDLTSP